MRSVANILARRTLAARLGGLLVGLLVVELLARGFVWDQRTVYEPGVGYVLAPGTWLWGREGWALSHWEEHGARAAPEAPADAPTVLVAGDSLTEAVHVQDDATYPWQLARALERRGHPAHVRAVGRSGASIPDYVQWSARWDEVFAPRVVVVAVSDDDFLWDAWNPGKAHLVETGDGTVRVEGEPAPPYTGARLVAWHVRQSSMALGIFPARLGEYRSALAAETPLFHAADATPPAPPARPDHPVAPPLRLLSRTFGARLVVLHLATLDPFAPREETDVERELFAACAAEHVRCVATREALAAALDRAHRDPYGFGQDRFGEGHLNELGHRAVAEALAPVVASGLEAR